MASIFSWVFCWIASRTSWQHSALLDWHLSWTDHLKTLSILAYAIK
jgi:hypothetical protein